MHWAIVAACLLAPPGVEELSATAVCKQVSEHAVTGAILVSEGDCLAVKTFTSSPYTHVGMIVFRRGEPYVYDSTAGPGVRCVTLANYLDWIGTHDVHLFVPNRPFSPERHEALEAHLDRQLGRPYAVSHFLSGQRAPGLHCAEYLTDALMEAHLITAREPSRVSPESLITGLTRANLYTHTRSLRATSDPLPIPEEASFCRRMWLETCHCTAACCSKVRGWFCLR